MKFVRSFLKRHFAEKPVVGREISAVPKYNRPFYRYGGHIEFGCNEYNGMPRGHEHDLTYSHQYLRVLFGPTFL